MMMILDFILEQLGQPRDPHTALVGPLVLKPYPSYSKLINKKQQRRTNT